MQSNKCNLRKEFYRCPECKKKYLNKTALRKHVESHTQIKPLKCNICQDSFLLRCDLSDHKKIHSKQYQCDQCYVFFDQKVGLDKHMLKHVGSEIPLISVKEDSETVDESQVMSDHSSKTKET